MCHGPPRVNQQVVEGSLQLRPAASHRRNGLITLPHNRHRWMSITELLRQSSQQAMEVNCLPTPKLAAIQRHGHVAQIISQPLDAGQYLTDDLDGALPFLAFFHQLGQSLHPLGKHEVRCAAHVVAHLAGQEAQFLLGLPLASSQFLPLKAPLNTDDPLIQRFGFVHKILRPTPHCLDHVLIHTVGAEHDDVGSVQQMLLVQETQQFHAIHIRHVDVQQHYIVAAFFQSG